MVFQDVTRARHEQRALQYQASHDMLTGLINRRRLEERLTLAINQLAHDGQHILCYVDLDYFKDVNDNAGHEAGDMVLRLVAQTMQQAVRENDIVARLGGDEFAIVLFNCPSKSAAEILEQVVADIAAIQFHWHGQSYVLTASLGAIPLTQQLNPLRKRCVWPILPATRPNMLAATNCHSPLEVYCGWLSCHLQCFYDWPIPLLSMNTDAAPK